MQIYLANKKQLFRTPFRTYLASVVTASKQQSVLKTLLKVSIRRRSTSFTNVSREITVSSVSSLN